MRTITPLTLKMLQAREPSVHAHFIFRFENDQGNQSFFLPITKIQLKRVNHKLSRRTVDAPSTGRFHEASSSPEKLKFGSARLSRKKKKKKANFADSRKLLLRGKKIKETKRDRFGKRSAATEPEEIDDRLTEADVNTRRSIEFFFSFFYVLVYQI